MGRRTFAEVIQSAGVDIVSEYESLHRLVYRRYGFYSLVCERFEELSLRGTTVDISDFNRRYQLDFEPYPSCNCLDDLLLFCEYSLNLAWGLGRDCGLLGDDCVSAVIRQVSLIEEKLGYRTVEIDGFLVLVEDDPDLAESIEHASSDATVDLFRYRYRGLKGSLFGKRAILVRLIGEIEPRRKELESVARDFTNDLFFMVNSLDVRHNNSGVARNGGRYSPVTEMSDDELEDWYDRIHSMIAAAHLLLGYRDSKSDIGSLKKKPLR